MNERKEGLRPIWVGIIVGLVAAIGSAAGLLDTWSSRASDRLFLSHSTDSSITIIAIDDASLGQLGRWPWPRRVHAELISKLASAGARVIAYDVNFPERSTAEDDAALTDALRAAGTVVLPVELQLKADRGRLTYDPAAIVAPISEIGSAARATGHSNTPPDTDGTVRRVPVSVRAPDGSIVPSFVGEVARIAGADTTLRRAPLDAFGRVIINFGGAPFRSFRHISAADVVRGRVDLSPLKDGIVFVGSTAADLHDALLVPTSYGLPMPGVEIHASLFDTILRERWLRSIPKWVAMVELLALAFAVALFVSRLRTRWSTTLLFALWICVIVTSFILFDRGWIVDIIWPTLTIIFATATVTIERRVTADRQRKQLKSALSRYVSPSVVESILKDPSKLKLGGERRRMSVLFSDIRGFTTISEGMSPEQLVHMLNIYLNRMTNIVFERGGVLDKYIGDAVMAFWNAPFDQPEHAKMAVETALEWQSALEEMNRSKAFGNLELHIGAGVNTGDMIVGNVGGDARFDYTVIGDNVNLGSRLEGLTKEYGVHVIVSEATQKELGGRILTRKLDKVAVKGKKEPVVIYEAMDLLASATPVRKTLAKDFEMALETYLSRNFADAITHCEAILAKIPDDGPSKTLLERARHFVESPPPADWVGTWVYTKK